MKQLSILALLLSATALSSRAMAQYFPPQVPAYSPQQMAYAQPGYQGMTSAGLVGEVGSTDPGNLINCQCATLYQSGRAANDPACANFLKTLEMTAIGGGQQQQVAQPQPQLIPGLGH